MKYSWKDCEKHRGFNFSDKQTDELFRHPLHKLLGLDKQLRSILGSLKVEVARKVQLEEHIAEEH